MPKPTPNLFTFATSELSQDAFLCWLLSWADPAFEHTDPDLHRVAQAFVVALFTTTNVDPPASIGSVQIRRQLKHTDVVATIGKGHVLVIEDKTNSSLKGAKTLRQYAEKIRQQFPNQDVACVFLKTGDQSCYQRVEDQGWGVFPRKKLLKILEQGRHTIRHNVFVDFLAHIKKRQAAVDRYLSVDVANWQGKDKAYIGLYTALQDAQIRGEWGLVNNRSGGFYGFWWGTQTTKSGDQIYLQIQEEQLVVKINAADPTRRAQTRDRWSERVLAAMPAFRRPRRFGQGKTMTLAELEGDYRRTLAGRLDLDGTVGLLTSYEKILTSLCEHTAAAANV